MNERSTYHPARRIRIDEWSVSDSSRDAALAYQRSLIKLATRRAEDEVGIELPASTLAGPATAYLVHCAADEVRQAAVDAAQELTILGRESLPPGPDICETPFAWVRCALGLMRDDFAAALPHLYKDSGLVVADEQSRAVAAANLQVALARLSTLWPEYDDELRWHVRTVVAASGPSLVAGSTPVAAGAILINERICTHVGALMESLVHEGSHYVLNTRMAFDPILRNPEAMSTSPLRPDPRPLRGILHAVFVTIRQANLAQLMIAAAGESADGSWARRRLDAHRGQIRAGLQVLDEAARPTVAGEVLLADLHHGAELVGA